MLRRKDADARGGVAGAHTLAYMSLEVSLEAVGLALLSSVMFALSFVSVRIGVVSASIPTVLWITLFVNIMFLWGWRFISQG